MDIASNGEYKNEIDFVLAQDIVYVRNSDIGTLEFNTDHIIIAVTLKSGKEKIEISNEGIVDKDNEHSTNKSLK